MSSSNFQYKKTRQRFFKILLFGVLSASFFLIWSLCHGNFDTSLSDIIAALSNPDENTQVLRIIRLSRLPRILGSVFVGAALSVSGLVYQELFQNRMASPDILGVSAGAGVGASMAIYFGFGFAFTSVFAFVGGIASVLLTIVTSKLFGKGDRQSVALILSGIVTSGLMNSLLGLFKYLSNDAQLSSITFWLLGGFYNTTYKQLSVACPAIAIGVGILFLMRWNITMLRGGDMDAIVHGIDAKIVRRLCIVIATIITSVSICISGTIGWIGLAIPNMIRLLVRNDGKQLFPLTIVYGILFSEVCDYLARTLTNTEIPIGIISGVLGVIMFLFVLIFQSREG